MLSRAVESLTGSDSCLFLDVEIFQRTYFMSIRKTIAPNLKYVSTKNNYEVFTSRQRGIIIDCLYPPYFSFIFESKTMCFDVRLVYFTFPNNNMVMQYLYIFQYWYCSSSNVLYWTG